MDRAPMIENTTAPWTEIIPMFGTETKTGVLSQISETIFLPCLQLSLEYTTAFLGMATDSSSSAHKNMEEEEEPSVDPSSSHFLWRLLTEESLSDWTIEVTAMETNQGGFNDNRASQDDGGIIVTYDVHKCHLASEHGRKSEYFSRLFSTG
jgi:hypothetical protein